MGGLTKLGLEEVGTASRNMLGQSVDEQAKKNTASSEPSTVRIHAHRCMSNVHTCIPDCIHIHIYIHACMCLCAEGYVCGCECMCTDGSSNKHAHAHAKLAHDKVHSPESVRMAQPVSMLPQPRLVLS